MKSNKEARMLHVRNTHSIYVIRACPHRKDWIAFGCRMGMIYVVDTLGKRKEKQATLRT